MTMFDVRLGWWFANPLIKDKGEGKENWEVIGPKCGFLSLLSELLASSRDDLPQVYLSDGGHFENLGLGRVLRDAGADTSSFATPTPIPNLNSRTSATPFERSELISGSTSKSTRALLVPDPQTGRSLFHCAVGKIHYGNARQELQRAPRVAWISPLHQAEPHRRRARRRVAIRGRQQGFPASNHA